jgi:plasmid rolling circle replication initiator protein Rep
MRGKENPEVTGLGGEVTPGPEQGDEKDNLPSRIERYSRAKHRASVMQKFCYDNDLPEHRALAACGNYLLFHHYYTVGKVRLVDATFCGKHLICPLCAIRRGSKMVQEYLARFQVLRNENPALKASMVTLTVKNGDDLEERFKHLKAGMQTLKGRRKNFKSKGWGRSEWRKVLGEVGAIEVKKGKNSNLWHPHAHILILHEEEIDWNALSSEWHEIT